MFDRSLAEIAELAGADDATLIDTVRGWAQAEAAAAARKLAAMAELFIRRTDTPTAQDRELWWVDPCAAVGAELGAAQGISQWAALTQARDGVALRDRVPQVAALLAAGAISADLAAAVIWRTYLIQDRDALGRIDTELAEQVGRWGTWSVAATIRAIDALVVTHDPGALRKANAASRQRYLEIGSPTDEPGTASLFGRLLASDAALLEERVTEMVTSVCPHDPRPLAVRRSDALGAIAAFRDLACLCGREDCTGTRPAGPDKNLVVNIVVTPETIDAAQALETGDRAPAPATVQPAASPDSENLASAPLPAEVVQSSEAGDDDSVPPPDDRAPNPAPAVIIGGGVLPAHALAEILPRATLRSIVHPGDAPPEPGYVPSRALADFVRCRDLTCRYPHCDKPADRCDIDHTVPYPWGCTHASNLKCLCRTHHLLKTFWIGKNGWRDRQLPDGTVIWTAPTGHEYPTMPGGALLIPSLATPTGTLNLPDSVPATTGDRTVMMPKRRLTRAENTTRRITAERKLNDDFVAQCNAPPPF
ncbi:DUF222 domain-containing protein [Mycolicibacterium sp. XJ870]